MCTCDVGCAARCSFEPLTANHSKRAYCVSVCVRVRACMIIKSPYLLSHWLRVKMTKIFEELRIPAPAAPTFGTVGVPPAAALAAAAAAVAADDEVFVIAELNAASRLRISRVAWKPANRREKQTQKRASKIWKK